MIKGIADEGLHAVYARGNYRDATCPRPNPSTGRSVIKGEPGGSSVLQSDKCSAVPDTRTGERDTQNENLLGRAGIHTK